jgi:4-hydroxybenzoate polyprenyltransferase
MAMQLDPIRERLDLYEKLMRLDKPIGILLLLWPTLWALWLSALGQAGLGRGLGSSCSAPC